MRHRLLATAALLVLASAFCLAAEPPPPATAPGLLSFADALLSSGDSFRAATEYLRVLHHFPGTPESVQALKGLGKAYAQAGRWEEAAETFRQLREKDPGTETRVLLGAALYRGGRFGEAAAVLLAPQTGEAGTTLGTLAALRGGMLGALPAGSRQDLASEYAGLPRKSPSLAGGLSAVLPGAGHLYCDRPRDALVSFLLNGLFLWGTIETARRDQWAAAGILGALELGWYAGGIVSSVNAAHKWNRREESRFFQKHEAGEMPRWSLLVTPSGVGLGWTAGW